MEQIVQTPHESINDSVVIELRKIEARTGLRYSEVETYYKKYFDEFTKENPKLPLASRQIYAKMRVDAETQNLNGISNYNLFVLGIKDLPAGRHVLGFSMMQKKDQNGKDAGDPQDLFDPVNGKFGIPTSVVLWQDHIVKGEGLKELTFYNLDGSPTAPGVPRREVRATNYTNFVGINVPLPENAIQIFIDKNFPLQTLGQIRASPSRLLPARTQGARQFADELDLKRVQCFITHSACNAKKDGSGDFCTYTVIDSSLSDAEKYNKLKPDGTVEEYGGIQAIVPPPIFKSQNLLDGAMIEILGTAEIYNNKLQLNAVSVKLIAGQKRKAPISQKPTGQPQGVQSTSLADMASKPTTYI